MIQYRNYIRAKDLEEAYGMIQKKRCSIMGGMIWLNLGRNQYSTMVDLCNLGLDKIEERENSFIIGAYVSLRSLETDKALNAFYRNAFCDALCHIEGVQLRNMANVGGTVALRAGFSDLCTLLLAMNAEVKLYRQGTVSMKEYMSMDRRTKDIVVSVSVPKSAASCVYLSERNSSTDLPLLNCAAVKEGGKIRLCIGARPKAAGLVILEDEILSDIDNQNEKIKEIAAMFSYETNIRASAEYRQLLAEALTERVLKRLSQDEREGR